MKDESHRIEKSLESILDFQKERMNDLNRQQKF